MTIKSFGENSCASGSSAVSLNPTASHCKEQRYQGAEMGTTPHKASVFWKTDSYLPMPSPKLTVDTCGEKFDFLRS